MIREMLFDTVSFSAVPTDRFKSDYFSISFAVPYAKETAAMNDLILKILKRGTVSYPDMISLSGKTDDLYSADLFTKSLTLGDVQVLSFGLDVLNRDYILDETDVFGEALDVLFELIYAPVTENGAFSNAYFESEKQNLLDDMEAEINNKAKYAFGRFSGYMFADEACKKYTFDDRETVASFTNAEVYAQYKQFLSHAKMEIVYVGNADIEKLRARLITELKSRIPTSAPENKTVVIRTVETVKEVHEQCVGNQGNLVMGFRTGTVLADGDYPRMALLCELYGGGASSKLFMNVREKMSLCYFCVSIPEATKGAMFVRAGIENANFEKAKAEILRQLDLVKAGDFTDEELETAKLSLINAYREISDNPQSIQNWYIGRMLSGITQSPEEVIEIIRAMRREEILETAMKIRLDTVYFLEGHTKGETA